MSSEYYIKNRQKIIEKSKKYYADRHQRKNRRYVHVIAPDGKEFWFEKNKDIAAFFGYSMTTVNHLHRLQGKYGYKIEKLY